MAEDEGNPGEGEGSGEGEGQDPGRSFTQAEVDRFAVIAKDKGQKKAFKELGEELGIELDKAKVRELIKAQKELEDKQKTDLERAQGEANQEKAKRESAEAKVAEAQHNSLVRDLLEDAGVPKGARARVASLIKTEVGASEDEIQADIDALREELPGIFEVKEGEGDKKLLPNSDPSGKPPKNSPAGSTATEAGKARAAEWMAKYS